VRATTRQLADALGVASTNTVFGRKAEALAAGVIEIANPDASTRAGNRYKVKVGSAVLTAAEGVPVFPIPEMVEMMLRDPMKAAAAKAAVAAEEANAGRSPSPPAPVTVPAPSGGGLQFDENGIEIV
jgi:hypothetical protein